MGEHQPLLQEIVVWRRPAVSIICCHCCFSAARPSNDWSSIATPAQLSRIRRLKLMAREPFDASVHARLLEDIWRDADCAPNDAPFGPTVWPRSREWTEKLGFQGDDPSRDLRACALLGLETIAVIVRREPGLVRRFQKTSMLYSAMALNCTAALVCALKLHDGKPLLIDPSEMAGQTKPDALMAHDALMGFASLLAKDGEEHHVLAELVLSMMRACLQLWDMISAPTLLDFPHILSKARSISVELLACHPKSCAQHRTWLTRRLELLPIRD